MYLHFNELSSLGCSENRNSLLNNLGSLRIAIFILSPSFPIKYQSANKIIISTLNYKITRLLMVMLQVKRF